MDILIYNIIVLILKHFKDKLRETLSWILQRRDIRSVGGHYEHSNKFVGFTKGKVLLTRWETMGFSRRLFYEVQYFFTLPYMIILSVTVTRKSLCA